MHRLRCAVLLPAHGTATAPTGHPEGRAIAVLPVALSAGRVSFLHGIIPAIIPDPAVSGTDSVNILAEKP